MTNHHDFTSTKYLESLGGYISCPKRGCTGKLIIVQVRYGDQNNITEELECTRCGKVIRSESLLATAKSRKNFLKKEDPILAMRSVISRKRKRP